MLFYDYTAIRNHVIDLGLQWDSALVMQVDSIFKALELDQEQVATLMNAHVNVIVHQMNPRNYSWKNRLFMVLYWLGIVGRKIPRVG